MTEAPERTLTQDEQIECFRNAAAHLKAGGCFVIENYIPALRLIPPGETSTAYISWRNARISRTVSPRAYNAMILSSKPVKRRSCFPISWGRSPSRGARWR